MLAMETSSRYIRDAHPRLSFKQRRSGYEPSDTETEWREVKRGGNDKDEEDLFMDRPRTPPILSRKSSPLLHGERYAKTSPVPRRKSKSPYKRRAGEGHNHSPLYNGRSTSPYSLSKPQDFDELQGSNRLRNHQLSHRLSDDPDDASPQRLVNSKHCQRFNYSRRSKSTPKVRGREMEHISGSSERKVGRSQSPLAENLIQAQQDSPYAPLGEINEMVTNEKHSKELCTEGAMMQSTDSFSQGDIFFSRDQRSTNIRNDNWAYGRNISSKPKIISEQNRITQLRNRGVSGYDQSTQVVSVSTILSRTQTTSSSAISNRQSSRKASHESIKFSETSGKSSSGFKKFTASRQKSQSDMWFSCVKRGPCRTSKSPETREIDEASFIEKAFVVENLRQFWADKHRPGSLSGFICHKQQAQQLKQLISHKNCPNILFKGPYGSGKKALSMALLREIYGASAWKISHELRYFHVQDSRPLDVVIPVASSPHHVELNLQTEPKNARYALMALVKELTSNHTSTPEVSDASFRADHKVIVLYEVDHLAENIQHLIKWIMDCYTDACKIVLCCEDDTEILECVKSRCKLITVDPPVTHEIMEVLIQIARKENFDLPMGFAAKIATKSKQNLRQAIMALEACRTHNYPFVDEQPIPLGWEEVLIDLAAEILADPSPRRQVFAQGKFQKLLVDFVHPKLILQKLVEEFLKGVDTSLRRELYYWHAYYDKRLPTGTSALLKLQEFIVKFMSIYRKSFSGRRG